MNILQLLFCISVDKVKIRHLYSPGDQPLAQ